MSLFFVACGSPPLARPEVQGKETPTVTVGVSRETSPLTTPTVMEMVAQEVITTPTVASLSPLNKDLQTVIFTVSGEQGPEIYRVQVDEHNQKVGIAEQINFPLHHLTSIQGIYPSPDGQKVAIWELYGDGGGSFVHILDVNTGKLTPLLGERKKIDQRAVFLDWSPNGEDILVLGVDGSDLSGSAWLVDVESHIYHDVNIKQTYGVPTITTASFSPDGQTIVYAQSDCYQCGYQLWQIDSNGSKRQLLLEDSKARVENIAWSPDGTLISFVQWVEVNETGGMGQLYVIETKGKQKRLLSLAQTDYYNRFRPVWSSDGKRIVLVMNSEQKQNNLYIVTVSTGQINQVTHLQNSQIFRPVWTPNDSQLVFLANDGLQTKLWIVSINDSQLHSLNINEIQSPNSSNLDVSSSFVWIP